jgi:uncharacterized protein (DUF1800 family)
LLQKTRRDTRGGAFLQKSVNSSHLRTAFHLAAHELRTTECPAAKEESMRTPSRWRVAAACAAILLASCGGGSDAGSGEGLSPQSASLIGRAGDVLASATQSLGDMLRRSRKPPPGEPVVSEAAAVRFLEQATFGPTPVDIAHVRSIGFDAWLDEQFATKPTYLPGASSRTSIDKVQADFFRIALSAPDQLRQRVAFALGQVMVVSEAKLDDRTAVVNYHHMLVADAFTTYRKLLEDVTLSPAMGTYLDMANNVKADPEEGTTPNENYAREVLQLFSIGLVKLNPDGTPMLDGGGNPIPSYSQDTIEGFAHVFTGWTYPARRSSGSDLNDTNYSGPMVPRDAYHETGTKLLLDGVTVSMATAPELEFALNDIAAHPNVGPFIGTRLIQALVKSNPSPAYVQRVAAAFADNGHGVRGDMKAVVRAVLLDGEARAGDTQPAADADGKLREPVLYMTRLLRAYSAKSNGAGLQWYSASMRQDVFDSPSVFNFYPPSYKPQGSTLLGPEFKLVNAPSLASRLNFAYDFTNGGLPGKVQFNFGPLLAVAADDNALIGNLDATLLHGTMPASLKSAIAGALPAAEGDKTQRAMLALYIVAASPAFNIQK